MTDLYAFHKQALQIVGWDQTDEQKHPRGNPKNPGQFRSKDSAPGAPKAKPPKVVRTSPRTGPTERPLPAHVEPPREKEKYTREESKARGDVFAGKENPHDFIPAGKYQEGDPRNDPEFEKMEAYKAALSDRFAPYGGTRASIKKKEAAAKELTGPARVKAEAEIRKAWELYESTKRDRDHGLGGSTMERFDMRPAANGSKARNWWVPERHALHKQILDEFMARTNAEAVPKQGKALVMAGPSGAGKSTFLNRNAEALGVTFGPDGKTPTNYVIINPDDFKEGLADSGGLPVESERYPGLNNNEMANIRHDESSYLAGLAAQRLMSQGVNVILDITLANDEATIEKYVEPYEGKYKYTTALVDGDMKMALNNAGNRWKFSKGNSEKHDGKRDWNGRFLPTSLVLDQQPSAEGAAKGMRSKNAESTYRFVANDFVENALVYDPYTQEIRVIKGKIGETSADPHVDHHQTRHAASLSGMLRAKGGGQMAHQTTEITRKIEAFKQGQVTRDALVHYLTEEADYAEANEGPMDPVERYRWIEGGRPYEAGTWDEVTLAWNTGLLPDDIYEACLAIFEGGK